MTNRKLSVGLVAVLATLASACDPDKVTQVNNNPNSPTDAPSSALFTFATRNAVGRWMDGVGGTRYAFLPQHFAEVQYPESDQYRRLTASSTSGLFNSSYNVELQDYELVERRGVAANQPGLFAPARIMKAWEFGILTDAFGDIPYSGAFKADSLVLTPSYDTQLAIYTDLLGKLASASTALGSANNELSTADPIYSGDPAGWRRFANSLRARHALRLINQNPTLANTELTAALAAPGGLILTNAENAKLTWPGDGVYDNPWANNMKSRDDHRVSTRFITYMRDFQDPRVAVLAMPAEQDAAEIAGRTVRYCPTGAPPCYIGLANALTHAQANVFLPTTSRLGAIFFPGATAYGTFGGAGSRYPSYLMTAAEVEFIRAEAAERGIGGVAGGTVAAAVHYNNAITRSMEMFGITGAAVTAYLARPGVAYGTYGTGSSADRQKQIAIQKWIALYIDPMNAWAEVRRTCQPAIVKPGPSATTGTLPRRLQYSSTERAVNAANVAAAVTAQGTDNLNTRVYWDRTPTAAPTFETGCNVR